MTRTRRWFYIALGSALVALLFAGAVGVPQALAHGPDGDGGGYGYNPGYGGYGMGPGMMGPGHGMGRFGGNGYGTPQWGPMPGYGNTPMPGYGQGFPQMPRFGNGGWHFPGFGMRNWGWGSPSTDTPAQGDNQPGRSWWPWWN